MRQEVVANQHQAEVLWQTALSHGMEQVICHWPSSEKELLGRVVERLGFTMMHGKYRAPDYFVTSPGMTNALGLFLSDEDRRKWDPTIPDGFVFRDGQSGFLQLLALVEYKVPNPDNLFKYREQFDGFDRLVGLITEYGAARGKELCSWMLRREIRAVEVSKDFRYLYIVPSDRSAGGIPTSMYGAEHFQEIPLPFRTREIMGRIRALQGL